MQVKHKSLYSINIDYKRICTFFLFAKTTKNKIFPVQPKYTSCLPACFVNPFILRILVVNFCATFSGNFTIFIIYKFVLLHPEFYRENFQFSIKKEHKNWICTASMLCRISDFILYRHWEKYMLYCDWRCRTRQAVQSSP